MQNKYLDGFKTIIKIRTIENLLAESFKNKKKSSFLHLSIGQEASAAGVCLALNKNDLVFGNHRSHGHYLAKGGDFQKMIFEIFGDKRGCCKGLGGSMHMLDRKVGFVGTTPLLGSVPAIVSGMSMSLKLKGKKNIAIGFVGDGSAEEGGFYETINIACLHKLPLLIVIEDNNYSVEIPKLLRKSKNYSHKKIVEGIGAYYSRLDGQDFVKIFQEALVLKEKILKNKKPAVLHLDVLRRFAHSGPNEDIEKKYRTESCKIHFLKDPIEILMKRLMGKFKYSKKDLEILKNKIQLDIKKKYNQTFNKIKSF
jgi:TPP-dependent pyruvate/acetoin dehydrogenase alpha subunit